MKWIAGAVTVLTGITFVLVLALGLLQLTGLRARYFPELELGYGNGEIIVTTVLLFMGTIVGAFSTAALGTKRRFEY